MFYVNFLFALILNARYTGLCFTNILESLNKNHQWKNEWRGSEQSHGTHLFDILQWTIAQHKRSPRDVKTETCSKFAVTPKESIALKLYHALVWVFLDFSHLVAILSQVVNKKHTVGLSWWRNVLVMVSKPLTWTIFLKPNQQKYIKVKFDVHWPIHFNFAMFQCTKFYKNQPIKNISVLPGDQHTRAQNVPSSLLIPSNLRASQPSMLSKRRDPPRPIPGFGMIFGLAYLNAKDDHPGVFGAYIYIICIYIYIIYIYSIYIYIYMYTFKLQLGFIHVWHCSFSFLSEILQY